MARTLEPADRIEVFHGALRAMIETTAPIALVFKHSQQIVSAQAYLDACGEAPIFRPGSINVRFFNVSESDGDMLMDVRGLTELGLHDLQCQFEESLVGPERELLDLNPGGVNAAGNRN
jgi:hypothetical protein